MSRARSAARRDAGQSRPEACATHFHDIVTRCRFNRHVQAHCSGDEIDHAHLGTTGVPEQFRYPGLARIMFHGIKNVTVSRGVSAEEQPKNRNAHAEISKIERAQNAVWWLPEIENKQPPTGFE